MLSPQRLEDYMRRVGAQSYESVDIPPFVAFFHPHNTLRFLNYARPVTSTGGDLTAPLAVLRDAYHTRRRTPRFEFVAEFAPELPTALEQEGFLREGRYLLMTCSPATYHPAPAVPGLTVTALQPDSPWEDYLALRTVLSEAFGEGEDSSEPSDADIERSRADIRNGGASFLARLDGAPVGGGSYTVPLDGLTELAGIGTLAAYRRRGIGTAVTAYAAGEAFRRGVEIAFLTAADEQAGRVYQQVGFSPYASLLAYAESL